jgi:hypothetical protein
MQAIFVVLKKLCHKCREKFKISFFPVFHFLPNEASLRVERSNFRHVLLCALNYVL